ncbi:hypothetical protein V8C35DRAFT_326272 [Trichoderma chlorosporum]
MDSRSLPSWNSMPSVLGMPYGCAWGLFDRNNVKDEVSTINLLQPSAVVKASKELKLVDLWPLDKAHEPSFDRPELHVTYFYNDEIQPNTQSGSQWDGLHWDVLNGIPHKSVLNTPHLGVEHWSKRGGIVRWGVLLDYVAFAARHSIKYNHITRHCITLPYILKMAKEQTEHDKQERQAKVKNSNDHLWDNHFAALASDTVGVEAWPPSFPWC